jgi:endonuclease YncB( thermonuclease family)
VVDGDTFWADVDLNFGVKFSHDFRVDGVDTPERRQETMGAYKEAKDYVTGLVNQKGVLIAPIKKEKYGRWLVRVKKDGVDLSEDLVEKELAKPYFGGKKEQ